MKCPVETMNSYNALSSQQSQSPTIHQNPNTSKKEEDFAEYMWMGEELEEFDRKVEEELWEEMFLEYFYEEMLDQEEEQEWWIPPGQQDALSNAVQNLNIGSNSVVTSTLNPNAPEFVPRSQVVYYGQER